MGRLASTEQINDDILSFHEIDRLASDAEYAERMERFRAELVTSSGTCLCAELIFLPYFLAEASCSIINLYQPRVFQLGS